MGLSDHRRIVANPGLPANLIVAAGAFSLPLVAPLVNLLAYNAYPLFAAEVWPLYAGLLLAGLLAGLLYLIGPRWVRVVMEVALVMLAVDASTSGNRIAILTGGGLALTAAIVMRRPLAPLMAFAGAVLVVVSALGFNAPKVKSPAPLQPTAAGAQRPALLHIILDEHVGIAGLPTENPKSAARRDTLTADYVGDGFRVYGAAFSQHMNTTNAIPQILNLGAPQPSRVDNRWKGMALKQSAYLDRLLDLGYGVRAYTTGWVDMCAASPRISCSPYSEGGLRSLHEADLSVADKSLTIAVNYMWISRIAKAAARAYDSAVVPRLRQWGATVIPVSQTVNFPPVHSLRATRQLLADLQNARPGEAFVAHLLLPHQPYLARSDCSLKPRTEWRYHNYGQIRANEDAYFEQVLCARKVVKDATAALERSPAGRNYIVVLHGDHGSRIFVHEPAVARANAPRDMVAAYSTFFAIKGPGIAPGYVPDVARVDDLLKAYAGSGYTQAPIPGPTVATVMLKDELLRPSQPVRMPNGWATQPSWSLTRR